MNLINIKHYYSKVSQTFTYSYSALSYAFLPLDRAPKMTPEIESNIKNVPKLKSKNEDRIV